MQEQSTTTTSTSTTTLQTTLRLRWRSRFQDSIRKTSPFGTFILLRTYHICMFLIKRLTKQSMDSNNGSQDAMETLRSAPNGSTQLQHGNMTFRLALSILILKPSTMPLMDKSRKEVLIQATRIFQSQMLTSIQCTKDNGLTTTFAYLLTNQVTILVDSQTISSMTE